MEYAFRERALEGLGFGGHFRRAALPGLNSGSGALPPLLWHSPRAILSSPSAAVRGAELLSALTPSAAFSLVAGVVAGSHTLTDIISGSGSAAILSTVSPYDDSSLVSGGHALRVAGRWWAGHWVGCGTGEILLGTLYTQLMHLI